MVGQNWKKVPKDEDGNEKPPTHLFKVVLAGDQNVGKSAFLQRFTKDTFRDEYEATLAVDFVVQTVISPAQEYIKLTIWDTTGAEQFQSVTNTLWREANAIILMYSVDDPSSMDKLSTWLSEFWKVTKGKATSHMVVVGNKADNDTSAKQVITEEMQDFANENGLEYLECSSKDDKNIMGVIEFVTTKMLKSHGERKSRTNRTFRSKAREKVPDARFDDHTETCQTMFDDDFYIHDNNTTKTSKSCVIL